MLCLIELTSAELMLGATVGQMRRVSSIRDGLNKNKHAAISDWSTDINGACAEIAVAKHLGVYWEPVISSVKNPRFKDPDVGDCQVRSTTHENGCLIVRPNDTDDERWYYFVVCNPPVFKIVGRKKCADCKRDEFWRGDSWWVPQEAI